MNEQDVIDRLGEPDAVLPARMGMTSLAWRCAHCKALRQFDTPVRPPSPCRCGGISFLKQSRVEH